MKYRQLCQAILVAAFIASFASCSKFEPGPEMFNSHISTDGKHKTIRFRIPFNLNPLDVQEGETFVRMTGTGGLDKVFDLPVSVSKITGSISEIQVQLSVFESIPDGKYIMSFSADKWDSRRTFIAEFRNEMLQAISEQQNYYSNLAYDQTLSAYTISTMTDFKKFLEALTRDPEKGAGRKFVQKEDLDWNEMKNSLSVGLEKRQNFAGEYDGGGYRIYHITYSGAGNANDTEVGLFRTLINGAKIKSLTIECNLTFSNIKQNGGMLAGYATGTVHIEDVNISGLFNSTVQQKTNIAGGLIGCVKDATITVSDVELQLSMQDLGEDIGGVIGKLENSNATISGISTPYYELDIYAKKNVGGIIGHVVNSSFTIKFSTLNHATTQQIGEMYKIEVKESNCGGVIGFVESLSGSSTIQDVDVRIPVGAVRDSVPVSAIGGLIGNANLTGTLTIKNSKICSSVGGNDNVGGLIGYCELLCDNSLTFAGFNAISPQDKSYVVINGANNTGGFIGKLEGNGKLLTFGGETRLHSNVTGAGNNTGGFIGYMSNGNISLKNRVLFKADSMSHISSTGNYTGGFCGYAEKSTVVSDTPDFNFSSSIPKFSSFKSNVICTVSGNDYVGGGFGYVNECSISNMAVQTTVNGNEYTGGIFGYIHFHNDVQINRCVHEGIVSGSGSNTGGVAGYIRNNGKLQYCINYGNVSGKDNTGGVVGKIDYFEQPPYTHYCVNTGNVTGDGDTGGVVGFMDGQQDCNSWTSVKNCANYGKVSTTGNKNFGAGGIVGRCKQRHGKIISCANHGEISGSAQMTGGIVGWMGRDPDVAHQRENLEVGYCANFGNVTSTYGDAYVGGISGYNEEGMEGAYGHSHLHACYNCGEILPDTDSDTGGLLGYADHYSATEDCINFGKVHHGNAGVGTRKTAAIIDVVNVYYLEGSGKTWKLDSDLSFTENQMSDFGKFSNLNKSYWKMGKSVYSAKKGGKEHPILKECPFQNISWQ